MIVELLTPLVIATAPIRVDVPEVAYNHEQQVSITTARADTNGYGLGTLLLEPRWLEHRKSNRP